jgi:hypothetical protein
MYTLLAHRGTAKPPESSVVRACSKKAARDTALGGPSIYSGHLGVLRPERPNLERQRRYDFWFRRA